MYILQLCTCGLYFGGFFCQVACGYRSLQFYSTQQKAACLNKQCTRNVKKAVNFNHTLAIGCPGLALRCMLAFKYCFCAAKQNSNCSLCTCVRLASVRGGSGEKGGRSLDLLPLPPPSPPPPLLLTSEQNRGGRASIQPAQPYRST